MQDDERTILIIDAMNLFVRSYSAYPTMSAHGYQMGGCIGFLKTLRKLANEMSPKAIYVAWEGGGSQKRRALYSEYKMNRKPEKLNRFYGEDIPDSDDNKKHQIMALLQMLKYVPVCQLYVSDCEGDDVIAYLVRGPLKGKNKVIVSSDKDMYQLLDDSTRIYSPHKKGYVLLDDVIQEFGVKPNNFAYAKALCGDKSDNIPGVKGLGFKTVAKILPILFTEEDLVLDDIFKYCQSHIEESKSIRKIIEEEQLVRRNWKLVYLDGGMLSHHQSSKIDSLISTFEPTVDRMSLVKALVKEGIGDFDVAEFMMSFNCIHKD